MNFVILLLNVESFERKLFIEDKCGWGRFNHIFTKSYQQIIPNSWDLRIISTNILFLSSDFVCRVLATSTSDVESRSTLYSSIKNVPAMMDSGTVRFIKAYLNPGDKQNGLFNLNNCLNIIHVFVDSNTNYLNTLEGLHNISYAS